MKAINRFILPFIVLGIGVSTLRAQESAGVAKEAQLLFKIPIGSFYADKNMPAAFKRYVASEIGPVVPVSLAVRDSLVYIPDIADNKIRVYSKQGQHRKDIMLKPDQKPNGFDLMPNGNIVVTNAKKKLLSEVSADGANVITTKKIYIWPFYVSQEDNNYVYQVDTAKFEDKNKKITGDIRWFDMVNKFNFSLHSDTLLIAFAHISRDFVNGYKTYKGNGKEIKEVRLEEQAFVNFAGAYTLGEYEKNYYILLTDGTKGANPMLLTVKRSTGRYKMTNLQNALPNVLPVIGENISYFPDAAVYKLAPKEKRIYSLRTDAQYIYVHYYDL